VHPQSSAKLEEIGHIVPGEETTPHGFFETFTAHIWYVLEGVESSFEARMLTNYVVFTDPEIWVRLAVSQITCAKWQSSTPLSSSGRKFSFFM